MYTLAQGTQSFGIIKKREKKKKREPDFEKSEILIIRGFEASDLTQSSFEKPSIEFLSLLGK